MIKPQDSRIVSWRIHMKTAPAQVFETLASDQGRSRFWAETAVEQDGVIHFQFPGGEQWSGRILRKDCPRHFQVMYFSGTIATFTIEEDGAGGTDLLLTDEGVKDDDFTEVNAGWVSVLLSLKAALDFSVDLRNHDPQRTWVQGYADN